ncbi:DUF4861 domain-containing protein [Marinoscillum sp. MHG1-6]|uniref:DUF4861 domain-containing protein n=1 Tax=Marinoscillum sp. MHG1-6 TaxID=2959627 RepID=UPI0021587A79|nr:DUF4861 domain-containing protein [Marinoscillum sp. MHG1-6]
MKRISIVLGLAFLASCASKNGLDRTFTIENPAAVDRLAAVVGISIEQLGDISVISNLDDILVEDVLTQEKLRTQWVDNDQDSTMDELLFLTGLTAGEKKDIRIYWQEGGSTLQPTSESTTYSRFVPERTDDYTWENDKVAFRTFGPEAQRMIEENIPGGTLSSGIDLWLKKVNYSIIDSWYEGNLKEGGYYHIDHGEGYDPYHVGKSRGTGGTGVWADDTLLTSKNFAAYRTIAIGPLRTVFELDYAPWSEYGVKETKRITLDLGSNFSKYEISLSSDQPVPNYTIGITLHEKEGEVDLNGELGYYSHWEPIKGSQVGEGIVIDPTVVIKAFDFRTEVPDQSQLIVLTDSTLTTLTYYAGFAWTESGQVTTKEDWLQMLANQKEIVDNPVKVNIDKP